MVIGKAEDCPTSTGIRKRPSRLTVVVVEGFFDCIRVDEAGYPCVALMGSSLSAEQEELVYRYFARVILLLDGDAAGRAGTDDHLLRLGRKVWVTAVQLHGAQPDTLSTEEIRQVLSSSPVESGDKKASGCSPLANFFPEESGRSASTGSFLAEPARYHFPCPQCLS